MRINGFVCKHSGRRYVEFYMSAALHIPAGSLLRLSANTIVFLAIFTLMLWMIFSQLKEQERARKGRNTALERAVLDYYYRSFKTAVGRYVRMFL